MLEGDSRACSVTPEFIRRRDTEKRAKGTNGMEMEIYNISVLHIYIYIYI